MAEAPSSAGAARPSDWDQVKALFDAALALRPSQREAFLAAQVVPEAVRTEVHSLLGHAQSDTGTWLAPSGLAEHLPPPSPRRDAVVPGQRFGAWEVVRPLGAGGMGEVFEARRADGQFEGRAAVKLLKRGMDSAAVLERFALERSALARLTHPNIARLYDAGQSEGDHAAGLPYFVMEYVDGQPIDAAARGLPLEDKLRLFLQLADAVAHAHRQLLVHRDLKPGNVLVTAEGQVKLLDFGIAKALDPAEAGDLGATTVNSPRPFTPHYASPEQVRGEAAGTSTDVYSLGVLLYELLTGVRPTGRRATSAVDAARSVLEEQPTRPSALTHDPLDGAPPQWLATRKRLQGDLDNVLLKALDKTREGRYLSVDAFAADIDAFLGGHPVSAQAPTPQYLAKRFVQRHRAPVVAAALALVAVIGGAGIALWQAREAERHRDIAQARFTQVRQLAKQLVFTYHDQIATLPGASKAREALLADAGKFLDALAMAADEDLGLAEELAGTWYRLSQLQGVDPIINIGQPMRAEQSLDKAIGLARRYANRPVTSMQALTAVVNMHVSRAELWQARGDLTRADAALREGLPLLDAALARDPRDTWALASAVSLHGVHARILGNQMNHAHLGRWQAACTSADRARAAAEATAEADPKNKFIPDTLAFTIGEQAHCRVISGRFDEADVLFAKQVDLRDRMAMLMPEDIDFRYQRSVARAQQARLWSLMGRHAAARERLAHATTLAREALAADAGNTAAERRLHAMAFVAAELQARAGDMAVARAGLEQVLARFPATDSRRFADIRVRAEALIWLARVSLGGGASKADAAATADAARAAGEAMALLQAPPVGAPDDNRARQWLLAQAQLVSAQALVAQGDRSAAAESARAARQSFGEGVPPQLQPLVADAEALAR